MKEEKTIAEAERNIIEEFSVFPSWEQKYNHIIQLGILAGDTGKHVRDEKNRVKGCHSDVWIIAYQKEGRIYFMADSDSLIVKGLAALLIRVLSGQKADSILLAKLNFIADIGLKHHLSPTRSNGLNYMVTKLKTLAMKYRTGENITDR